MGEMASYGCWVGFVVWQSLRLPQPLTEGSILLDFKANWRGALEMLFCGSQCLSQDRRVSAA